MPKISVIVPVYNDQDYLEECVDSVREQTFPDWELILVNDGSTDGSGELCRTMAGEDCRIRVYDKANGGVGSARNIGLDAADGEYVTFLDSDDSYLPEHLETLLQLTEDTGADVVASGMKLIRPDGTVEKEIRLSAGVYTGTEEILSAYLLSSGQIYGGCNKLFSRKTISDIRFTSFRCAEDALFCVEALSRCGTYAVSDAPGYCYFKRSDSVTLRASEDCTMDQVRAWEEIYKIVKRQAPELSPRAAGKIVHDIDSIILAMPERKRLLKTLRDKYYRLQFPEGKLPAGKALASAIFRFSPDLYYRLNALRYGGNGGSHG